MRDIQDEDVGDSAIVEMDLSPSDILDITSLPMASLLNRIRRHPKEQAANTLKHLKTLVYNASAYPGVDKYQHIPLANRYLIRSRCKWALVLKTRI